MIKKPTIILQIILFAIMFFVTAFVFGQKVSKQNIQDKNIKKELSKDTLISVDVKSYDTEKYLRDLEKQMATLRTDYFKTIIVIMNQTDTTYLKRLIADPEHFQRKIYLKLKK